MSGSTLKHSDEIRTALIEAFGHPLRVQVLTAIYDHPGVTINQMSTRLREPSRKVRYQLQKLVGAGLVVADGETLHRNMRERHYRGVVQPSIDEAIDDHEDNQKVARGLLRLMVTDAVRAAGERGFGSTVGHVKVRIPGEVDKEGWDEIGEIMTRAMREIEAAMVRSAARLEDSGESGIEAMAGLLLYEGSPWDGPGEERKGPRPSAWRSSDRRR